MTSRLSMGHLDLLLLAGLAPGPAHGYGLIGRIRDESGGQFELLEGTVYPALHRLEGDGLVSSRWTVVAGRRRRTYELTGTGVDALVDRRADWARFSAGIEGILGAVT